MKEITVARSKKLNIGKYEMEEVFASVKVQVLDSDDVSKELDFLDVKVKVFVDDRARRIKLDAEEKK